MNNLKRYIFLGLVLILISGIIYAQSYIELHKITKNEMLYFVPKKEHLVYTSLGFKPVVADLLWLRGVSYFIYHIGKDNDYKYLFDIFNDSILLDPQFKQVYRDAMTLLLSDKEHYPDAEKIILEGMKNLPQDWEIYYMAGILYAYYIKDENKSLRNFEKCWGLIPRTEKYQKELENTNIMIRSLSENKNDKTGLMLYWLTKFNTQENKESKDFCKVQIQKYASAYMQERLNDVYLSKASDEEKGKILNEAIAQFKVFYKSNKLGDTIEVPIENIFSVTDGFGYPWVFSERESKFYSFGNAREYLSRKINIFNIALWKKIEKYMTISVNDLVFYYPAERVQHIKLKQEYSEFPAFEDLFVTKTDWLKLEYPLFPIYERAKGIFRIPEYKDLVNIDKKYK